MIITCPACRTRLPDELAAGPKHRATCRPTTPHVACAAVRARTAVRLEAVLADEAKGRGF